jgi:hypothetical protein
MKWAARKSYGLQKCGIACCLLRAGFLLGLLFDPVDGGNMF